MRVGRVGNVNPNILKECREQMAYEIKTVRKTIPSIDKLEAGAKKPTFKQLAELSKLYCVPDWVFISEQMPERYKFASSPSFRRIWNSGNVGATQDPKICRLISKVDEYRQMILEYREDLDDHMPSHKAISYNDDYKAMATAVRQWLGLGITESFLFKDIRKRVEQKNIFVFKTSNMKHWSQLDTEYFRGFAIYQEVLPMIVINGSDAQKAQSFTLCHELGHIIRKKSTIDIGSSSDEEENWCNNFAGHVLMPEEKFRSKISEVGFSNLEKINQLADSFCVSAQACVIHLNQLEIISKDMRISYLADLKKEWEAHRKELKNKGMRIHRYMHKEALHRFGQIYATTVWQAYDNDQIGLHKLCKLFEIKRANVALSMRDEI